MQCAVNVLFVQNYMRIKVRRLFCCMQTRVSVVQRLTVCHIVKHSDKRKKTYIQMESYFINIVCVLRSTRIHEQFIYKTFTEPFKPLKLSQPLPAAYSRALIISTSLVINAVNNLLKNSETK